MNLSPQAERALCAYLTQVMLNDEASRYTATTHLSSRPTHINPANPANPANPYIPLNFDLQDTPTLPDWTDAMDDFDHWDYL